MSRIALSSIRSLTFYKGAETLARRSNPIPQLTCFGKACKLYTPDVVRCQNVGGSGTEVDWKCEADLPDSLRFGRVEVSCEGWSAPGDPYVLKGSCGLEYRLVHVPDALRRPESHTLLSSWDISTIFFYTLWGAFLVMILYSFFKQCFGNRGARSNSSGPSPPPRDNRPSGGWFPGGFYDHDPPPPYSPNKPPSESAWRPGFWTGAALGGLGASLLNNRNTQPRPWDWERERFGQGFTSPWFGGRRTEPVAQSDDRGEGSSRGASLGSMRRSTGLGGSNVR